MRRTRKYKPSSPFDGPGAIQSLCRHIDWGATSLGPGEGWARALRLTVRMCLNARFPMAVWAGPELVLIYNEGYTPVLGPERHPWALGRPAREVWADLWDRLGPELEQVTRHGESTLHEDERFLLQRRGANEECFFTHSFTPIQEDDGRIIGALNVFLETTERVRALRQRTLQAIIDTIPTGLLVLDANGGVSLSNEQARHIWNGAVGPDETRDYFGYWPDTGERLKRDDWPGAQALLHGRRSKDVVIDIERSDGTRGTAVVSAAPLEAEQGTAIHGAVVAAQDISELRAVQKRLEEADRRKDHFLAVLSHELRTPLTPIVNSLYILRRAEPGSDQALRARDVIERQTHQLSHIVDDLLDLTRVTQGKVQLQRSRLDLNALTQRTLDDHRTLFASAGLEVALSSAPTQVLIDADPHRMAQVLGNLLQNALKFTPAPGRVTLGVATDTNGRAVVRVTDTGAGMSPETLARLFEPFAQADSTLDRSKGGLGLGLSLVKALVEQHGGSVEARSEGPGRGSEFTVWLPLAPATGANTVGGTPSPRRVPRRVLVIEDNVDAADSLQLVLELLGHDVVTAHDGITGVAQAREFRPEVVLCDIGLPGMDGFAVARVLRADERLRAVRLVALSGYALPEDLTRAAAAGFDRHIKKPPAIEKLEEALAGA